MVRYYCDYCDTYLTHDSVSSDVRQIGRGKDWCSLPPLAVRNPCSPLSHGARSPLLSSLFQVVVRKQHNSGFKHKVRVCVCVCIERVGRATKTFSAACRRRRTTPSAAAPSLSLTRSSIPNTSKANVRNYYTRMLDVAAGILPSQRVAQPQQQQQQPQQQPFHHHRGPQQLFTPPPWGRPGAPYQGPYGPGGGPPGGFPGGPPRPPYPPPGSYGPPR